MGPQFWKTCALVTALSVPGITVVGCTGNNSAQDSNPAAEAAPNPAGAKSSPKSAHASKRVTIDNFTFDPPTLIIAAGTKVTWVNHDDVPHTATSTAKPRAFNSGTLDTDDKFSFVFTTPGTYEYFCAVHPKMTGRVIVK